MANKKRMSKKKRRRRNLNIGILATFVVLIGIITFFSQAFVVVSEEVWLPRFWTAECVARADHLSEVSLGSIPAEGKFFECTSEGSGKWIPDVSGMNCEYFVTLNGLAFDAWNCPLDATLEDHKSVCNKLQGEWVFGEQRYVLKKNRKIFINPTLAKATATAKYPSFGLRVRDAQGFVDQTTIDCIAKNIKEVVDDRVHSLNLKSRLVVTPDAPFNAVTGLSPAISTHVVSLSGVEGGDTIYITRPGFYNRVEEAEDGFLYVDTGREFSNSAIECIPRTIGCSDEATIIKLEDQSCDKFGGAIQDYAAVEGDTSKLCKYECTAGKLDMTSDCIKVQPECTADKPLWDATTGDCIGVEGDGEMPEENFLLYVVIAALVVILLMILVKMSMRTEKR